MNSAAAARRCLDESPRKRRRAEGGVSAREMTGRAEPSSSRLSTPTNKEEAISTHRAPHSGPAAAAPAADADTALAAGAEPAGPSTPAKAPKAAASAAAAPWRLVQAEGLGWVLARARSFVACLSASVMLRSALLALEAGCQGAEHPPVLEPSSEHEGACTEHQGLPWTIAQLLALFLRTRDEQATPYCLLPALWLLDAFHTSERDSASDALQAYLHPLAHVDPPTFADVTAAWPASFTDLKASMVAAQAALLPRLGWSPRLGARAHVRPCHELLFARGGGQQLAALVAEDAEDAAAVEAVQAEMRSLCRHIRTLASRLGPSPSSEPATPARQRALTASASASPVAGAAAAAMPASTAVGAETTPVRRPLKRLRRQPASTAGGAETTPARPVAKRSRREPCCSAADAEAAPAGRPTKRGRKPSRN